MLLQKYKDQIKCIYIDPPYNTGEDGFPYKDNYQHSSWLTMIKNRIAIAKELLSEDGVIFIHIDENEQYRLRVILEEIFGIKNYLAPLIWISRAGKGGTVAKIQISHEYVESAVKDAKKVDLKTIEKEVEGGPYSDDKSVYRREQLRQWGQYVLREDRPCIFRFLHPSE